MRIFAGTVRQHVQKRAGLWILLIHIRHNDGGILPDLTKAIVEGVQVSAVIFRETEGLGQGIA